MERLLPINGFENYLISDEGYVFSLTSHKRLRSSKCNSGYLTLTLCDKGMCKHYMTHRLVALHFIDNPNNLPQVNHKDGDKLNNDVSNLEWVTQSQNVKHSYDTNPNRGKSSGWRGKFGSNHNRSKKIYEFDLLGNLLNEYESGLDFMRKTGISHTSAHWSIKNNKPIFNKLYFREPNFQYGK